MSEDLEVQAQPEHRGKTQPVALAFVAVLCIAVLAATGALIHFTIRQRFAYEPTPSAPREVVTDAVAPPKPEIPQDERARELALDPSRTEGWNFQHSDKKTVYLTFDDGPSHNTKKIIDILDQYGAKATFFVTGHQPELRHYIKEAYEKGHTIGLHTMTHDYAQVYSSVDAFYKDLDEIGQVVKEQIGYVPFLTRFPGGASNTISRKYTPGIMSTLAKDLPSRGYQFYDWNIGSSDASGNNVPVDKIVASSCVEGYTNAMILFHDAPSKNTTVEALPRIIEWYKARGYEFAAIDRSTMVVHHGINN